jgi:glucokinase
MSTLAIDVGGTKFSMAVFEGDEMVARETRSTDREGGRDWMLDQIVQIGREFKRGYHLERCGIGFGGPVQFALQRVHQSTHVGGWNDFALPQYIEGTLKVPSIMDNDANVGALGEGEFGAARGFENFVYMTLSTGIGGGLMIGGQLYRGADSFAGELGHMTLRSDGPDCLCGARGCFERLCCGLWLQRDHGKPASELMQDASFVKTYVVDLALGLKNCIMLLNPDLIVIGGGISKAGDALFVPLREELRRQITAWSHARVAVAPSALGDDSVLRGALVLANQL